MAKENTNNTGADIGNNSYPNIKVSYVLANSPCNIRDWTSDPLCDDKRLVVSIYQAFKGPS